MQSKTIRRRIIVSLAALFLLLLAALIMPLIPNDNAWIRDAQQHLAALGNPPAKLSDATPGQWASEQWLIFSNGWASFAYKAPHDMLFPQNLALLRTAHGNYYICHYHFCVGPQEYANQPMPKDIEEFMRTYEQQEGWRPLK